MILLVIIGIIIVTNIITIIIILGKFRHSLDGIKGVSFDGLTSRGIDRDRLNFNATGKERKIRENRIR